MKRITIAETAADFAPEPLLRPFGFKGGSLTELWQTHVRLASADRAGVGLGVQSCLWSDAAVFAAHPEREANEKASWLASLKRGWDERVAWHKDPIPKRPNWS